MNLKILLPSEVFLDQGGVLRVVADTHSGSFGLLPRRRDCVAALSPGILVYETKASGESFVAVDEGILIKAGPNVLISVRRAVRGRELGELRKSVQEDFLAVDEAEQKVRLIAAKLEAGLVHRLARLSK